MPPSPQGQAKDTASTDRNNADRESTPDCELGDDDYDTGPSPARPDSGRSGNTIHALDHPGEILGERGHSFVLGMEGKNLLHADCLRKADMDPLLEPLPQQQQAPPPAEEINGEQEPEFEIDKIKDSRTDVRNKRLEYQADWIGYDPDEMWYPAANFKQAPVKLDDFHKRNPLAPGPPIRLQGWMRTAAEDCDAVDHEDDNIAEHGEQRPRKPVRTQVYSLRHWDRSRQEDTYHPSEDSEAEQDEEEDEDVDVRHQTKRRKVMPSSAALFEEWPLKDAIFKRVTVGGHSTFQLQFTWDSAVRNKSDAAGAIQHEAQVERTEQEMV